MATELLATGVGPASSSEFTVDNGTPVTVCMKSSNSYSRVNIELKADDNSWVPVGELNANSKALVITAAGTYRVTRLVDSRTHACGVFRV